MSKFKALILLQKTLTLHEPAEFLNVIIHPLFGTCADIKQRICKLAWSYWWQRLITISSSRIKMIPPEVRKQYIKYILPGFLNESLCLIKLDKI